LGINMGDCPERCPRSHPPFYGRVVLYDSPTFVYQAIEAGTAGYILNRLMVEELNLATEALPGSGERISPEITRSLALDEDLLEQALHGLTPPEREIFQYLACGMSVKDIAEELVLSPYTVYTHLSTT